MAITIGVGSRLNTTATRWAWIWELENRELRSALLAEKEHIQQLQGKLEIVQAMVPIA